MIDDGLFEGIDAALLFHPCDRDHVECISLATEDVEVRSPAAGPRGGEPWMGRTRSTR